MSAMTILPVHDYADPISGAWFVLVGDDQQVEAVDPASLAATEAELRRGDYGASDLLLLAAPDDIGPAAAGWTLSARYVAIDTGSVPTAQAGTVREYQTADIPAVAPVLTVSVREGLDRSTVNHRPADLLASVTRYLTDTKPVGVVAVEDGAVVAYVLCNPVAPGDLEVIDFDAVDRARLSKLIPGLLAEMARRFPGHRLEASVVGDDEHARKVFRHRCGDGWAHTATLWQKGLR